MEDRATPVLVRDLPGPAIAVSAGYAHTCALLQPGNAYCWGDNTGRQTDPSSNDNPVMQPRAVAGATGLRDIRAGQGHTCGITQDDKVLCWGNTIAGQCGVDGPQTNTTYVGPTLIPGLDGVKSIDTVKNHICAVRASDPTLVCWGSNQYLEDGGYIDGKLGPAAAPLNYSASPVAVNLGSPVVDVGMGFESTYAVTASGLSYAWGYNGRGQLGTQSTAALVPQPSAIMVSADAPLLGAVDILRSDGSDNCVRMSTDTAGSFYDCWGADDHGELGFGVSGFQNFQYAKPTTVLRQSATNLVRGENHGCFTATSGGEVQVFCYGLTAWTGDGASDPNQNQPTPAPVKWDPANFTLGPE